MSGVSEPPLPEDGTCALCGETRVKGRLLALYAAAMRDEPFCSTECCREWYGIPLQVTERRPRGYTSKLPVAG